ncbi:MAG: SGNH/GDSL hydrolase family protein [Clostridiales bacterium]|nr:SGNH/GDSL hydrolase family protein [Clostridiales bacterium]
MSQTTAPKISILGDGISTFAGYTLPVASIYSPSYASYSGFDTAEGTWWMQAIQKVGGVFLRNSSSAGSYVSYKGHYSAALPGRIRVLATETEKPDVVLVYTGLNDAANDIELTDFRRDYLEMLHNLRRFYPEAQIWVGTLCRGREPILNRPYFIEPEHLENFAPYNEIIRECAQEVGVQVADFAADGVTYESVNGVHPTRDGMVEFADAWAAILKPALQ